MNRGDTKHPHPWDYPECPACQTDVLVAGEIGPNRTAGYRCHGCDRWWSE